MDPELFAERQGEPGNSCRSRASGVPRRRDCRGFSGLGTPRYETAAWHGNCCLDRRIAKRSAFTPRKDLVNV
jgi:hypothetical protein